MGDVNLYQQPARPAKKIKRKPPRALSEDEKRLVAEQARLVKRHMPELLPVISEFYEIGLIDGWRAVRCTPHERKDA